MGNLSDAVIRGWLRKGERVREIRRRRSDADLPRGVRASGVAAAVSIGGKRGSGDTPGSSGKARVMVLGSYRDLSLADARETARKLRARVTLGHDVADEKQERQRKAVAKIDAARNVYTVAQLADDYFKQNILGRWKHPNIVRARIEKDIRPNLR